MSTKNKTEKQEKTKFYINLEETDKGSKIDYSVEGNYDDVVSLILRFLIAEKRLAEVFMNTAKCYEKYMENKSNS